MLTSPPCGTQDPDVVHAEDETVALHLAVGLPTVPLRCRNTFAGQDGAEKRRKNWSGHSTSFCLQHPSVDWQLVVLLWCLSLPRLNNQVDTMCAQSMQTGEVQGMSTNSTCCIMSWAGTMAVSISTHVLSAHLHRTSASAYASVANGAGNAARLPLDRLTIHRCWRVGSAGCTDAGRNAHTITAGQGSRQAVA
jgi:hypothetical protein